MKQFYMIDIMINSMKNQDDIGNETLARIKRCRKIKKIKDELGRIIRTEKNRIKIIREGTE